MNKRFKFQCWYCERTYTLYREISAEQVLLTECPYCHQKGVVDLPPYRKPIKVIYSGENDSEPAPVFDYVFPETLPTRKPE